MRRGSSGRASASAGEPVYRLDIMNQADVPDVSRVEKRCFANPWPTSAYRRELQDPALNYYVVLRELRASALPDAGPKSSVPEPDPADELGPRRGPVPRRSLLPIGRARQSEGNGREPSAIIGFAGMWLAFDEAHVTTIGVEPEQRGRGLGELLLLCMLDEAIARGANWLTLEVRVTNAAAQSLYRKYGFRAHGTRKRYYSDNNEDALIMWSPSLGDAGFRGDVETRRAALEQRLGSHLAPGSLSPFPGPATRAGTA